MLSFIPGGIQRFVDRIEKYELKLEESNMLCLSNIVIKRNLLDKINDWETRVRILWTHLFIVFKILNSSAKGFVFSYDNPLVTVQYGNQGWVKK